MLTSQKIVAVSAIALTTAFAVSSSTPLRAQAATEEHDGPGSGVLMLRAKDGNATPAVQLGTDMDVIVSGQVARVRVTQAFRNTSDRWVEASYLYPLPEDGAVDTLKMVVGQRIIIGQIKRRQEAQEIYEKAKEEGRKASLVEQQRPNLFTNRVANVGPGETVLVSIEYQAPVRQMAGAYSLRLPLVAGPRYVPPRTLTSAASGTDARKVNSAPIARPVPGKMLNPVSITVRLSPGFAPARLTSPYHRITVSGGGASRTVQLAEGQVPADRDFELSWGSSSTEPSVGLFRQHVGSRDYVMASIVPPVVQGLPVPPREMVFVIDNSGSMSGESMNQAKASLENALRTLRPQDHFNVIRFDDTMTKLFDHSVPATSEQVSTAIRFARGLEAEGGTEMLPALIAALADAAATGDARTLRQIVFLTDGDVSNEEEMSAAIARDGGKSRVFLVGIGSAPNNYLMSRMAAMGRGTYTNIGTAEEVTPKMAALLDALKHPAVQDVKVTTNDARLELTPRLLPDIYAGQPLVVLGRTDRLKGTLTVSGRIGNRPWASTLSLADAVDSPAVAKLWARKRIDDVETERTIGNLEEKQADEAVAAIGLEHSIVTSQTSLVAEDKTPSRRPDEPLAEEDLPINLPHGWNFDALLGGETARAAIANADQLAAKVDDPAEAIELPQTATNYKVGLGGGLLLMLAGALGLIWQSRRRKAVR